ncbi:MAG: chemoreceptor glutamine deamidase CheD [Geminicoccaceae bacterium]
MTEAAETARGDTGSGLAGSADGRRRYFDPRLKRRVVQIFQGDYYVTSCADELLQTVLGSCVAACVRDPISKVGGMNHFLLPSAGGRDPGDIIGFDLRYGSFAMEQLINAVLKVTGRRDRLEIKVFGGANVVRGMTDVGHRNADFVETFLRNEGLSITGSHLRGNWPRKVQFSPASGRVRMRELKEDVAKRVFDKEIRQRPRLDPVADSGTVELFD